MSCSTFFPLFTAPLVNYSAEVGKEKSQLGRALLTMTSFPLGLAQPVLGLIASRPGFVLLSVLSVPLGAGAILRRGWGRSGGRKVWGRNYRILWAKPAWGQQGHSGTGWAAIHLGGDSACAEGSACAQEGFYRAMI